MSIAGLWAWRSGAAARTARNVTLPEALRLADLDRYGEAFVLAADAERAIPTDPVLASLWPRISRTPNIITSPAGADVSFALIGSDNTWHPVGRTPLENVRVPRGVFRWRFGKPGFETREVVRATTTTEAVFLPGLDQGLTLTTPGTIPPEMVLVSRAARRPATHDHGLRLQHRRPRAGFPDRSCGSHQHRVQGLRRRRRLRETRVLDRTVRSRRPADRVVGRDEPLPRPDRAARACNLGRRRAAGRARSVPRERRELVRGGRLRRVSRQAAADDLSLVTGGESGARRRRDADEQFRRIRDRSPLRPLAGSDRTARSTWPATSRSGCGTTTAAARAT